MLRKSNEGSVELQQFVEELAAAQSRIRAYVVSLMPGSPDVEDVLQETNIVLWKSRKRFQLGTNFIAWAFAIARLEVLHYRTRAKREKVSFLSDEVIELLASEAEEETATSVRRDYLQALDLCKEKLQPEQLMLIDKRYQPDESLEKFALETNRKPSALRVALMRIREVLRDCVNRTLEEQQT